MHFDTINMVQLPHYFDLILKRLDSLLLFMDSFLLESLDCIFYFLVKVLGQIDIGKIAFSYLFDRFEVFVEIEDTDPLFKDVLYLRDNGRVACDSHQIRLPSIFEKDHSFVLNRVCFDFELEFD